MKKIPALPRRSFLKAAAGFAGASIFGGMPFRAFADQAGLAPEDHCFVFAYFNGGWDVLLSLDPRDPAVFTTERISETRILPGYNQLTTGGFPQMVVKPEGSNIDFGPAIGDMAQHFDQMAVVRGINMATVAHEVGYRYFLTGKEPNGAAARGSTTATEIVGQMKPKAPVPNIAYNVETYNDRYGGYANALRVSSSNDLLLTLAPSATQLDSEIEKELVDMHGRRISCEADLYDSRGLVTQYRDAQAQMQTVLDARLDRYFRFEHNAADPQDLNDFRKALRVQYKLSPEGPNDVRSSSAARAALIATALKLGVSQCVSMNIAGGLDTHFGSQVTHATNQRTGWNALAALVSDLKTAMHPKGGNWMEHTTIVVFSEFSRTPLINAASGRDHHITNSCMLLGKGIKHNMVFGKSGDVGMSAGIIDHHTGRPDAVNGFQILPDHIIATVMKAAGIDYSITRVEPLGGLLA
ncbi:MAG: DUF1501 domain-containing protein [Archangium sp.]